MAYNKTAKILMKKLLLVALALLVSTASFAQLRTAPREVGAPMATKTLDFGQASNFTFTTLDNQTLQLQDWLDSGYYVLLDISATWCSWCWRLHSAHVLETLYQNYGPNGTNEMRVLWVEGDPDTDPSLIYGGSGSQGNWTAGVSYPIASHDNVASLYGLTGYPMVILICPSGYYQDAYAVCDWNGSQFVTNTSVAAIYNLLGNCPAAGEPPVVEIEGLSTAVINIPTTFTASYVSVDSVSSVTWTIPGATPSTGTGDNITVTFPATGTYTVTLEVTNTSGTTTKTLDVNVIEWNWDNTMSYDITNQNASNIGTGTPGAFNWGAKYPAAFMANRNYLDNVQVYSSNDGHFTMTVYQTNPGVDPSNNDMLYQYTYAVTANAYNTLIPYDRVQLDPDKDLWITFNSPDIGYPAAGSEFSGDPNGSLVSMSSPWTPIYEVAADLVYSWMIRTTTSATAPALYVAINGPTNGQTNETLNFTAVGPAAATYSWSFDGGSPATATGNTVSTSFTTGGNHTVTLTANYDGESATATTTVNIISCETQNLPWSCGFEASDNLQCWQFIDQDGDGYNWMHSSESINASHNGSGSYTSQSYVNYVGPLTPDNYMITPKIRIPAEGATIEWWDYSQDQNDYAEHYGVFVSTTGTNAADFTNSIYDGTCTSAKTWVKRSRSLAGFAGQEVYIAFRHYNVTNMFWLAIDDIKITAGNTASISEVENARVALYPNPVSSILNIEAQGIQEVSVLDINGRTVMSMQNTNTIDMSNLANGVYFVRVITTDGVSTQKITRK